MRPDSTRRRPTQGEYFEYYDLYVSKVPDGDIIDIMKRKLASTTKLIGTLTEDRAEYRYAREKWSVKEVFSHVVDVEWVFTHRALWFARKGESPLPGMEHEDFMAASNYGERSMSSLVDEFHHLRSANIVLFDSFGETILDRTGEASGCSFSVRSIPYIVVGHELHHISLLKDKYL